MANGIADDMLTTTILAAKCPKYVSPAMNTNMFENPIVQDNIKKLEHYGFHIIDPASGYLACGDTGAGKMPEPETLFSYIMKDLACEKDMVGKKVMVTAGPTQEKIDPVRYITNHSTGKMGYAIAENCMRRGAEVTLITGPVAITPPPFVKVVPVVSAADMAAAVRRQQSNRILLSKRQLWRIIVRITRSMRKSRKKTGMPLLRWNARKISFRIWARTKNRDSFCVDFPWRRNICWRIPVQNLQKRMQI